MAHVSPSRALKLVSRGSRTDQTWRSDECPQTLSGWSVPPIACEKREIPCSLAPFDFLLARNFQHLLNDNQCLQLCLLVDTSWGVAIFTAANAWSFCCGPLNSSNSCNSSTRGSTSPFPIQAGRVVVNGLVSLQRTAGSHIARKMVLSLKIGLGHKVR